MEGATPTAPQHARDVHGRAALLLVESLIHGLIDKSVLTTAEAVEIIDVAGEVEAELRLIDGNGEVASLLAPLAQSLLRDQPGD